jgi:CBS domain-containing protein
MEGRLAPSAAAHGSHTMIDIGVTAADIMTREIITIAPGASILEAAKLLAEKHISGVPVVEDSDRLVGMLSDGDLIAWEGDSGEREAWWLDMLAEGAELAPEYVEFLRAHHETVRSVMKTEITAIGEDTPIRDIAALMLEKGASRLPVVRDGRLIGIVARADLVRVLSMRLHAAESAGDRTAIPRGPDRPLLDSEGMAKQDLADSKATGRKASRPLFP